MFCETQKQTFLSIGMLILFLLFVLCLAFTGTTTTQEEETGSFVSRFFVSFFFFQNLSFFFSFPKELERDYNISFLVWVLSLDHFSSTLFLSLSPLHQSTTTGTERKKEN